MHHHRGLHPEAWRRVHIWPTMLEIRSVVIHAAQWDLEKILSTPSAPRPYLPVPRSCHHLHLPQGPSDSTVHILSHQNFNCHHHKPQGPRHSSMQDVRKHTFRIPCPLQICALTLTHCCSLDDEGLQSSGGTDYIEELHRPHFHLHL